MSYRYWFQVHGDPPDGCEVHLYCDAALVHVHYFHGFQSHDLAYATGLRWMSDDAPDPDPLSAAPGYQSHPDG